MRGRYADVWQRRLAEQPVPKMLESAVRAGFGGLLIDREGVADELEKQVRELLDAEPITSADGRLTFHDLSALRRRLEQASVPGEWSVQSEKVLMPVLPTWEGEVSAEERSGADRIRWVGPRASITLHNRTTRSRKIRLTLILTPPPGGGHRRQVRLAGLLDESLTIHRSDARISRILELPPGRHSIRLWTDGATRYQATYPYRVVFGVKNLRVEESELEANTLADR
jgi:hypothetical protein